MKKVLSLILSLALACSLAVPSLAAEATDQRLTDVVTRVKQTLGLDTDRYASFHGELDDNPLAPIWYLDWSGEDGGSLSIEATEAGKVVSYYLFDSAVPDIPASYGRFAPSFPQGDRDSAKAAALAFLKKVLTEGETVRLEESTSPMRLGADSFRFYGEILVNGLRTDLSFSLTVRAADQEVTRFYRDDLGGKVMGGIPSPRPSVTAPQAASVLRDTLSLHLEYVLPEDGGTQAVLRWLPDWGDEYYVDAETGTLVNLSELYEQAADSGTGGATNGAASDSAAEEAAPESPGLSQAEQEGIAKLEGVLDREALDGKARGIAALGLDKYSLAAASYSVARETEEGETPPVTASLRYGKQVDGVSWRRNVTLDARTGELLSVYSSGRLAEDAAVAVDFARAQANAEAFLAEQCGTQFGRTALSSSREAEGGWSWSHSFTYAQQENGYFYKGNSLRVGVDAGDGSISSYEKNFDDSVTFDSAEDICTAGKAVDAWLATYDTALRYVSVPAAIDFSQPEYAPLEDMGLSYLYRLALGYQLEQDDVPLGIDAKTAKPVYREQAASQDAMAYSDIAGHWARRQIEALAQYGVGYTGGTFQPGKSLTQLDLVALLVSTGGYTYSPEEENAADRLYDMAYGMGILSRGDRDDGAVLTRAEAVKLLLDAAGYGEVARLQNIFRTDFADDGEIPEAFYGYAALAAGLGIVRGGPGSRFLPGATATRAEAAVMLYNLMSR